MDKLLSIPSASALKGAFEIYKGYWFMAGPAFALALQFYLNHRFGLVEVADAITFPDILCGFSCLIMAGFIVGSHIIEIRGQQRHLAIASAIAGILSIALIETPPPDPASAAHSRRIFLRVFLHDADRSLVRDVLLLRQYPQSAIRTILHCALWCSLLAPSRTFGRKAIYR